MTLVRGRGAGVSCSCPDTSSCQGPSKPHLACVARCEQRSLPGRWWVYQGVDKKHAHTECWVLPPDCSAQAPVLLLRVRARGCNGARAIMWGAKSGEELLPAFPEPSHQAAVGGGMPSEGRDLVVRFTRAQARQRAHKMVRPPPMVGKACRQTLLGSVLGGLPMARLPHFHTVGRPVSVLLLLDACAFCAGALDMHARCSGKELSNTLITLLPTNLGSYGCKLKM